MFILVNKLRLLLYFQWQLYKSKIKPYLKPNMLISFGIAWMITNGWSYILAVFGEGVVRAIALSYLSFLWLPFTPEKLITIPLSVFIQKTLFVKKER